MNNQKLEVVKGIGFIYHNLKLIVLQPVGSMLTNRENLNIKQEATFLKGGVQFAFPCDALGIAYQNLEAIQSNLGKPNDEIPVIISVLDEDTEKLVEDIYNEFEKEYSIVKEYQEKGYQIKGLPYVYHNIEDYIPTNEKIEQLSILNIDANNFDIQKLIENAQDVFYYTIDSYNIPFVLRKSIRVNHVFVVEDETTENTVAIYIPFAAYVDVDEFEGILCLNGDTVDEDEMDFGNVDLDCNNSIGYLIKLDNNILDIKIANYTNYQVSGQTLVQVVEDTGIFKELMEEEIQKYIK